MRPNNKRPQGSVWKVLPRSIQILLKKEDEDTGFWERLLKDKQLEKTNVKASREGRGACVCVFWIRVSVDAG